MGNEWGKNPQKNGDSVPDFFIASDSFPAIQESMVTPTESTKARKMKQI